MDKDRELGRIASTATKRRQSEDHARSILPQVREAFAETSATDRGASLRAIADWLNARDVKTQKNRVFRAQTVSRLLYQTEEYIAQAATKECETAVGILRYERVLRGAELRDRIAELERVRDGVIERGKELGRALRGDGLINC